MILLTLVYINKTWTHTLKKVDQEAIRPINQVFYEDNDNDDDDDEYINADQLATVANFEEESLTKIITEESIFQSVFDLYEKALRIIVIFILIIFFLYLLYICFPLHKNDKVYKSVK